MQYRPHILGTGFTQSRSQILADITP